MLPAILFSSRHGRTRKVVAEVAGRLTTPVTVIDVADPPADRPWTAHDPLVIFCPTYGDEELEPSTEDFLLRYGNDLAGHRFAVCELGNYYGYDDFSFGALHILRRQLLARGGREFCPPLSLDSLPRLDSAQLDRWIGQLNTSLSPSE